MKKIVLFGIALLYLSTNSWGESADIIEIVGKVSMKGNEPFSYLAITDQITGEHRLVGDKIDEIKTKYQQLRLRVKGRVIKACSGFGSPAEFEVIDIIEVKNGE